jgi:mono/diheme cytochrome c family protein
MMEDRKMNRGSLSLIGTAVIVCGTTGAFVGGSFLQAFEKGAQEKPGTTTTAQQQSQPARSGDVTAGKALYEKYGCWACHGYAGQGGGGPRLAPKPLSLARFTAIVRRPPSQMPPYTAKIISDRELADIHAYLGTIPAPPDLSTIPLLQEKKTGGTEPSR